MVQEEALIPVLDALNQLNIPFMVVGAIAVNYYSIPRLTHDADIVIELLQDKVEPLCEQLEEAFYIDVNMIRDAIYHRDHFNLIHYDTGFKIDFWVVGRDKCSLRRFGRRVPGRIFDRPVFLITPEDLILSKLEWYRQSDIQKHFLDAQGIFRMQKDVLDMAYLNKWAVRLEVEEYWVRLKCEMI